jgi:hypothetical protein
MNICGVCNKWKCVTQPRDYGYPKIKGVWNKIIILKELNRVKELYEKEGNNYAATTIQERVEVEFMFIDEIKP